MYQLQTTRPTGIAPMYLFTESSGTAPVAPKVKMPHVLVITSYPPRECGIATYSQDLIAALEAKFHEAFSISICALEEGKEHHPYAKSPLYVLDTECSNSFIKLAFQINRNPNIDVVLLQHEFGFFRHQEAAFTAFLELLEKPLITVFHTVLPNPNPVLHTNVRHIAKHSSSLIVMTTTSMNTLHRDYDVHKQKVTTIPHGTHLIKHQSKKALKQKHGLIGRKVLSTFGLISSGKGINTTLEALPAIVQAHPEIMFLIIGKTHPGVVKHEGERYRESLQHKVVELGLQHHVKFINRYLSLPELLEHLQMTDIYLFTSTDPGQAVSGTFAYALSCGCPVISTPIPHAREVLRADSGILIDFNNSAQLAHAAIDLLCDEPKRNTISSNGLHHMASTAWQNSAIAHAMLFEKLTPQRIRVSYTAPTISLAHLRQITTSRGIIQFSKLDKPDITSGYTLDDNARALIVMCQHFELTNDSTDSRFIRLYLNFIVDCLQPNGNFLNYMDENGQFTAQNDSTNLEDANGRAIWALGLLSSLERKLPNSIITLANNALELALPSAIEMHSTRAMGFIIKGLYYRSLVCQSDADTTKVTLLANRMVQMYRHEADANWHWFESYFTYANSILPEALLCAYEMTGNKHYREIATTSFDFLLSKTFGNEGINVVSNKGWMHRKVSYIPRPIGGEQPIDVAYTIMALDRFNRTLHDTTYRQKITTAFDWFLGRNHLHQTIYNPCTGGCYDGLEEHSVNLNQGAESTVSYLMARLVVEKYKNNTENMVFSRLARANPAKLVAPKTPIIRKFTRAKRTARMPITSCNLGL
jgi:glycosyltransferase involved in cell wall biosynthesis